MNLCVKKSELILIIMDFLKSENLDKTLVSLEDETGVNLFNYNREIMFFRQLILDGQWKDAEEFLTPLREHSKFEYNSSIYQIRKQKFLEHVEQEPENKSEEIEDLVEMLKDLQARCSVSEFNDIMTCLQSPSITDHPEYRNWTPLSGRLKCFQKLRKHLELIYPISKDEVKVEPSSFSNFVLNCIQNNPNFANLYGKSLNENVSQNQIDVSLLKLMSYDNNNLNKGNRKIYNANKNRILIEDDLSNLIKGEKASKEDNDALMLMRKSNSSLKAIRNERISQSLNLNKIAEIELENAEDDKADNDYTNENESNNINNEEFANQLYEVYEANEKRNQAGKILNNNMNNNIKVNEVYKSEENEFINEIDNTVGNKNLYKINLPINSKTGGSQYGYGNNNNAINNNSKYNFYNNEINVIEEEERSKKDEEIDLDDIDENMELNQNNLTHAYNNRNNNYINSNNNNNTDYTQNSKLNENIRNKNVYSNEHRVQNKNTNNFNNPHYIEEDDQNDLGKLNIVEEDAIENNNINYNNNKSIDDNALSDLDKEEYFMKSCYDFFDYDITTLAERKVIEDSHPIRTSCFSSKGDYFAIGTNSKSIKLFHIKPVLQRFNKKNSYNFKSDMQHQNNSNNLLYQFNNNNSNSRSNISNNKFQNINNNFNNEIEDIKMVFEQANHHMGSIYCLDWSLSGRLIASGSNDRLIKLMVVPNLDESLYGKDYETLELMINGHEGTVRSVCFEPTNDLILLSGGISDQCVKVWDTEKGTNISNLEGHTGDILSIKWSNDSLICGSTGVDRTIRFWDLRENKTTSLISCLQYNDINDISIFTRHKAISSTIVAAGHVDGMITIWDYNRRVLVKEILEHTNEVRSVSFSPDGKYLVSASFDSKIKLFDVEKNYELIGELDGHNDRVVSVRWHPEVPLLISTSADRTARLWIPDT